MKLHTLNKIKAANLRLISAITTNMLDEQKFAFTEIKLIITKHSDSLDN